MYCDENKPFITSRPLHVLALRSCTVVAIEAISLENHLCDSIIKGQNEGCYFLGQGLSERLGSCCRLAKRYTGV